MFNNSQYKRRLLSRLRKFLIVASVHHAAHGIEHNDGQGINDRDDAGDPEIQSEISTTYSGYI